MNSVQQPPFIPDWMWHTLACRLQDFINSEVEMDMLIEEFSYLQDNVKSTEEFSQFFESIRRLLNGNHSELIRDRIDRGIHKWRWNWRYLSDLPVENPYNETNGSTYYNSAEFSPPCSPSHNCSYCKH